MFWENELHILQGPHRPNSAIWEPAASQGTKCLNPFQGKPRTQCYLDPFPSPEFNYRPGQPGNQLLVKFCIPRAQGILIILKGKIKRFIFKMQISLAGLLRPRVFWGHNVTMSFEPTTIIFSWFPVPGSLLARLFWLSPVWGARFLVHSTPYFMINLIQFPM